MKKLISIILCLCLLLPCLAFTMSAEGGDTEEELQNIAPEAVPSVSSNYFDNILWTNASFINDGIVEKQFHIDGQYIFWWPNTPLRDPSLAGIDQWCKLSFKEYKEISSIEFFLEHGYSTVDNVSIDALVDGEWVTLGVVGFQNGELYYGESNTAIRVLKLDLDEPVTTKYIKFTFRDYIVWDPPTVAEIFVYGKTGKTPAIDVPEGAYLSTNASLGGRAQASSASSNHYPALANDDNKSTYWSSSETVDNQWYMINFDKAYSIGQVGLNLNGIAGDVLTYNAKIELLVNNTWTSVYEGTVTTSNSDGAQYTKDLTTPLKATAIKVTYLTTGGKNAVLTELSATTSDGTKAMYIGDIISTDQKNSTAAGNLACYGTPYASSVFDFAGVSEISYINDGLISDQAFIWVAATPARGEYCGVKLTEKNKVDSVSLYFNDEFGKVMQGEYTVMDDMHVLAFDIQCKNAKGEYVTVASGTSYDKKTDKPIVTVTFDPVETDDVRVVFTSNGGKMAYLKEIEIYGHATEDEMYVYPHYEGFPSAKVVPPATTNFSDRFVPVTSAHVARIPKADMRNPIKNINDSFTKK